MPHDRLSEVSALRMDNAKMLIETANVLIEAGDYKSAANRAYYAVFNAMRACLALHSIDHKKHSGVISDFRLHFIKTEKLKTELSDVVSKLFYVRTQSDYNDFYIISKDEVTRQLENARFFVGEVEAFLIGINGLG